MNYDMSYYDLYTSRQNIKYICQTLLISNPNINGIFVILANNQTLGWSNGIDFDYKYKPAEDDWYKETLDLHGRLYISDLSKKDFFLGAGESVFFAKALHNIYTNDYLGTVLIDCSPEIFDLSSVNMLPSDIYISLTDADNPDSIYYANTKTPIRKEQFEDDPLFISKDILNGNFTMNVAMNHDYFADNVNSATRQMYLVAMAIMAVLALVYIPLLNGVIKPIRKLTNHMHATHFRQPANMPKYSKRSDEIGLMYREYGVELDRTTAGLLLAAILSDTLFCSTAFRAFLQTAGLSISRQVPKTLHIRHCLRLILSLRSDKLSLQG